MASYSISSARATIFINQIVRDVLISIQAREYTMDLIVLPGLAIYVILGMSWMRGHGVLIDTTTRTIMLREPKGGSAFIVPLPWSLIFKICFVLSKPLLSMIFQWFANFLMYF